jgi:co-chaperonin GroES (HSP10)
MRFLPMPGRIYLVLDHIEDKKVGSIIIAVKQANTRIGTVTEVGDGVSVKVGARVLVTWVSGVAIDLPELETQHDQHRIITENEILAVVQE